MPYHLSPEGRARKHAYYLSTFAERFWAKVAPPDPETGCRPWIGAKHFDGYGQMVRLGKIHKAHRIAWELANGEIPEGLVVCHRCDNPPCCEVSHLFLGTRADNNADRAAKGRNRTPPRGEQVNTAKLTAAQVLEIRRQWNEGQARGWVHRTAREYGVQPTTIYMIIKGQTWKHLRG